MWVQIVSCEKTNPEHSISPLSLTPLALGNTCLGALFTDESRVFHLLATRNNHILKWAYQNLEDIQGELDMYFPSDVRTLA